MLKYTLRQLLSLVLCINVPRVRQSSTLVIVFNVKTLFVQQPTIFGRIMGDIVQR